MERIGWKVSLAAAVMLHPLAPTLTATQIKLYVLVGWLAHAVMKGVSLAA